jgi:precorrin-2 dehydrogenase/sirohydrochlorin ferrochelatase
MTSYFPIFLNLKGKRCIVVGGGQVAVRKVKALLEAQGDISVISPALCPELLSLSTEGKINVIQRDFRADDLVGCWLAIAATDNKDINLLVADIARKAKVLVNIVDDADSSNFIFPSSLRRGEITIAVSTSGRSPALARKIRSRLEKDFGEEYTELARLIGDIRLEAKKAGIRIEGSRWQEALDVDLLVDLVRAGKHEDAKQILRSRLNMP